MKVDDLDDLYQQTIQYRDDRDAWAFAELHTCVVCNEQFTEPSDLDRDQMCRGCVRKLTSRVA